VCYEGIAKFFENSKYVKAPNESIAGYVRKVICNAMGVLQT
jgi:hypothetical protein